MDPKLRRGEHSQRLPAEGILPGHRAQAHPIPDDAKELGEELAIDVENFQQHPDVRNLVCLVFDPEARIDNPRGIEKDLTRAQDSLALTVRIIDAVLGTAWQAMA